MVQLNTTYDSSLKQKMFVLKGDEGYARTTDVTAELVTDFGDYDNHISYCHVGLAIKVLRELGKSTLYIYADDELLYAIPWHDTGMAQVIDFDWNDKGVYWDSTNKQLLIGKYETTPEYIDTGLFLLYDVEHTIKVKYLGNKNCLGSHAKPIVFTVPTPDTFASTLTLSSATPSYMSIEDVDNIKLLLESQNTLTDEKDVKIYINNTYYTTVSAEQDTQLTIDLSSETLSDGLHTIKAVFDGDDEAYGSETELNISIGYKVLNLNYPSVLMSGDTASVTCQITDYFDTPYGGQALIQEYITNLGWENISDLVSSDVDGVFTFNPTHLSNKPFAVTVGTWHDTTHTTNIVSLSTITLHTDAYTYNGQSTSVYGVVKDTNNNPVADIPVTLELEDLDGQTTTQSLITNVNGEYSTAYMGTGKGIVDFTATVTGTQIIGTNYIFDYKYFWDSSNNVQAGTPVMNSVTISRQNNGYKFSVPRNASGTRSLQFNYGNGKWETKFNLVDISDTYDWIGFNGIDITEAIGSSFVQGATVRIVHKSNNTMEFYVNDILKSTYDSMPDRSFELTFNDAWIILDSLRIYRGA